MGGVGRGDRAHRTGPGAARHVPVPRRSTVARRDQHARVRADAVPREDRVRPPVRSVPAPAHTAATWLARSRGRGERCEHQAVRVPRRRRWRGGGVADVTLVALPSPSVLTRAARTQPDRGAGHRFDQALRRGRRVDGPHARTVVAGRRNADPAATAGLRSARRAERPVSVPERVPAARRLRGRGHRRGGRGAVEDQRRHRADWSRGRGLAPALRAQPRGRGGLEHHQPDADERAATAVRAG